METASPRCRPTPAATTDGSYENVKLLNAAIGLYRIAAYDVKRPVRFEFNRGTDRRRCVSYRTQIEDIASIFVRDTHARKSYIYSYYGRKCVSSTHRLSLYFSLMSHMYRRFRRVFTTSYIAVSYVTMILPARMHTVYP